MHVRMRDYQRPRPHKQLCHVVCYQLHFQWPLLPDQHHEHLQIDYTVDDYKCKVEYMWQWMRHFLPTMTVMSQSNNFLTTYTPRPRPPPVTIATWPGREWRATIRVYLVFSTFFQQFYFHLTNFISIPKSNICCTSSNSANLEVNFGFQFRPCLR